MEIPKEISNTDDCINSRNIQERIDHLESLDEEEDKEELQSLLSFKEEVQSEEWDSGIGFIRESYFREYTEEFAEDIGAIGRDRTWPLNHIDWEAAANELLIDYSSVEFDGITYYYR